ncbi:hypothetical protein scyTo_0016864 [Scyliorhinus torazame]|uniref:Uncharacterized protein n=1 Tax=Scyliorhinus torazame TaxID=75743 RepID=A0A401Q038_SCYTO|nr:hypothetical protein [Scyliorhinus torazame]
MSPRDYFSVKIKENLSLKKRSVSLYCTRLVDRRKLQKSPLCIKEGETSELSSTATTILKDSVIVKKR